MNTVRFVKSFNKGQLTLPKQIRDYLGIGEEFWLRLYVKDGKIIAEPIPEEKDKDEYAKKLLNMKTDWFDIKEFKKNRKQIEKQIKKREL